MRPLLRQAAARASRRGSRAPPLSSLVSYPCALSPASSPSGMKRANDDAGSSQPAKRSRTTHTATIALMNSILANPKGYPISASEEIVRKSLVDLATYARHLEQQLVGPAAPVAGSSKAAAASKPSRSPAELAAAADKLRKAAVSGIKKQMSVSGPRAS